MSSWWHDFLSFLLFLALVLDYLFGAAQRPIHFIVAIYGILEFNCFWSIVLVCLFIDVSWYNFQILLALFNLSSQLTNLLLQLIIGLIFPINLVNQILLHLFEFGRQLSLAKLYICYFFEDGLDGFWLACIYGTVGGHWVNRIEL